MVENTKVLKFKCPFCGHEWSIKFPVSARVSPSQKCQECNKYIENAMVNDNPWEQFAKKEGK